MKTLIQNYGTGHLEITDIPVPSAKPGGILVQTYVSLVSAGTERQMVELAQKNLLEKALERPDLVRRVIDKVKKDGLAATIGAVRSRLDNPVPLGYSSAGIVVEVGRGRGAEDFRVGDRVACAGAGYASHAEVVFVPKNLAVSLPDEVDFESAAFTTLGAIALQGLRLADLHLGEIVAVIGLGLVGLLTVQLAKASGCRVLGMDPDPDRCRLAVQFGCDETATDNNSFISVVSRRSQNQGADAVLITAATKSSDPVALAGEVTRDRGVVVAVGQVGMDIPRKAYYEKELTFRVSRSYGPGRYDRNYENKGQDYPIGYVRWTEQRNLEAFVQLLAEGKVNVKPLITHRFPIEEATKAYDLITGKTKEPYLGILLTYPKTNSDQQSVISCQSRMPDLDAPSLRLSEASEVYPAADDTRHTTHGSNDVLRTQSIVRFHPLSSIVHPVRVGLLGAGEFAKGTLLPAMKKVKGTEFVGVCAASGISANHAAKKFGFHFATTDENEIISNADVNTVVIATRHHHHARQIVAALKAGKHVFVEKPLCLNEEELRDIVATYHSALDTRPSGLVLMVGFNRRFSPMARKMKEFLSDVHEPLVMHYRINAGYIPRDHWVHDPEQGGDRIIGEMCHFVDFLTFLAGFLPQQVYAKALPNGGQYMDDNLTATIEFSNGSLGTITYVANGDSSFSKEQVEVFSGGSVSILRNFRSLEMVRNGSRRMDRSWLKQDKGHLHEMKLFFEAASGRISQPLAFEEVMATTLTTLCIRKSLRNGAPFEVSI